MTIYHFDPDELPDEFDKVPLLFSNFIVSKLRYHWRNASPGTNRVDVRSQTDGFDLYIHVNFLGGEEKQTMELSGRYPGIVPADLDYLSDPWLIPKSEIISSTTADYTDQKLQIEGGNPWDPYRGHYSIEYMTFRRDGDAMTGIRVFNNTREKLAHMDIPADLEELNITADGSGKPLQVELLATSSLGILGHFDGEWKGGKIVMRGENFRATADEVARYTLLVEYYLTHNIL